MNLKAKVVAFALLTAPLFVQAQGTPPKPAVNTKTSSIEKVAEPKVQRLDDDLNNDGIIDAVQSLSLLKATTDGDAKKFGDDELQKDLKAGFRKAQQVKRPTKRSACADYLLLSPKEKDRVNQKIQSRTTGEFGTRPCDPFVSPMLERPYDNNYVELPLLPHTGVVVRD